jgi:hypothetical protein
MDIQPNDDFLELLPWEMDLPSAIATFACYEAFGQSITLKNGSEAYPRGWLRFLKLEPEDITKGARIDEFSKKAGG